MGYLKNVPHAKLVISNANSFLKFYDPEDEKSNQSNKYNIE